MGFRVLGPVELWTGDRKVDLGPGKQRSVLAVLLLASGRPSSVDSLIDRVWGEDPPPQARKTLYSYISRLRGILRDAEIALHQRGSGYVLEVAPELVDFRRFEALTREARGAKEPAVRVDLLRRALDCWHGSPLQGVPGRWADEVRQTLHRQRVGVCVDWARAMIDLGRHDETVELLEREFAEYPDAESLAGQLMIALQRQGRRAEALTCYATLRARLADDLGVEPGTALQRLHTRILQTDEPAAEEPAGQPSAEAPYLGLATFQAADAGRFFGRQALIGELLTRLSDQRFLAVFGPSGSGKSSLLRAGLLAAVAGRGWTSTLITPGEHPLKSLAGWSGEILVVDQFEEIFTLCSDDSARAEFVDTLISIVDSGTARVVIGVRADFYAACAGLPALVVALRDRQVLVGPMAEHDLRSVVVEPAERAGLAVEPALVDVVVAEVLGEPAALPLVSHALLETWRRRNGDRRLTVGSYQRAGGVRGAIAQTADSVYAEFDPDQRLVAREVLLRLIAPGDGPEDTRRRVHRDELLSRPDGDRVAVVLDRLGEARLVTLDEDTVTIVHESLVRCWPTLREWINEDRDRLRAHRRLTEAASEWDTQARDDGMLYRGARLVAWRERDTGQLNDLERRFLAASGNRETREHLARRRRVRGALVGLVFVVVAMSSLATVALVQAERANRQLELALAGQLSANARTLLPLDPELSLILAKRAVEIDPSERTQAVLAQALVESRVRATWFGHQGPVTGVDFKVDGRQVATSGADGTVRLWSVAGLHAPIVLTGHQGAVRDVAYSQTGDLVASAGDDGTVRIWGPNEPVVFSGGGAGVVSVAWNPNSRQVAAGSLDGKVRVWSVDGSGRHTVYDGHPGRCGGGRVECQRQAAGQCGPGRNAGDPGHAQRHSPDSRQRWRCGEGSRLQP